MKQGNKYLSHYFFISYIIIITTTITTITTEMHKALSTTISGTILLAWVVEYADCTSAER